MLREVREKYIARLCQHPEEHGFSEIKFIHSPQITISRWVRQRCLYTCSQKHKLDVSPPMSPTAEDTFKTLDEYRFGLMLRREEELPRSDGVEEMWLDFERSMVEAENEAFIRGYGKAFCIGAGNCLFCHHDNEMRPCQFGTKTRPTLEAIGVNLYETFEMIAWEKYLVRQESDPFQLFGLLLLE